MRTGKIKNKGFTLVEMIVYIGALVIVSVLLVNSILVMLRAFNRGRLISRINTSGEIALERIIREVRGSDSIDSNSIFGVTPSTIILDKPGSNLVRFSVIAGNMLSVQSFPSFPPNPEGYPFSPLLSSGLQATRFMAYSTTTPTSKMIRVELEITGSSGSYQKSETFYGSAILRRSY